MGWRLWPVRFWPDSIDLLEKTREGGGPGCCRSITGHTFTHTERQLAARLKGPLLEPREGAGPAMDQRSKHVKEKYFSRRNVFFYASAFDQGSKTNFSLYQTHLSKCPPPHPLTPLSFFVCICWTAAFPSFTNPSWHLFLNLYPKNWNVFFCCHSASAGSASTSVIRTFSFYCRDRGDLQDLGKQAVFFWRVCFCFASCTVQPGCGCTHQDSNTHPYSDTIIGWNWIQANAKPLCCLCVCLGLCQKASSIVKTFPCVMHLSNVLIWHRLRRVFISGFLGNHIYSVFSEQPQPKKKNGITSAL